MLIPGRSAQQQRQTLHWLTDSVLDIYADIYHNHRQTLDQLAADHQGQWTFMDSMFHPDHILLPLSVREYWTANEPPLDPSQRQICISISSYQSQYFSPLTAIYLDRWQVFNLFLSQSELEAQADAGWLESAYLELAFGKQYHGQIYELSMNRRPDVASYALPSLPQDCSINNRLALDYLTLGHIAGF